MMMLAKPGVDINLKNNTIRSVYLNVMDPNVIPNITWNRPATIRLSGNPLLCDCWALGLVKYIRNLVDADVRKVYNLVYDELYCSGPARLANKNVKYVTPNELSCKVAEDYPCPASCTCNVFPFERKLVIDCSYKELIRIPVLPKFEPFSFWGYYHVDDLEVHLEGNRLRNLSCEELHDVKYLYLHDNKLEDVGCVPRKAEVRTNIQFRLIIM